MIKDESNFINFRHFNSIIISDARHNNKTLFDTNVISLIVKWWLGLEHGETDGYDPIYFKSLMVEKDKFDNSMQTH